MSGNECFGTSAYPEMASVFNTNNLSPQGSFTQNRLPNTPSYQVAGAEGVPVNINGSSDAVKG